MLPGGCERAEGRAHTTKAHFEPELLTFPAGWDEQQGEMVLRFRAEELRPQTRKDAFLAIQEQNRSTLPWVIWCRLTGVSSLHHYWHLGTCRGKSQTPSPHRRPQATQPCPPACLSFVLLCLPSLTVRENPHHGGHHHVDTMSHISFPSLTKFL